MGRISPAACGSRSRSERPLTPLTKRKATPHDQTRDGMRWLAQNDLYVLAKKMLGYADMTPHFHKPMLQWTQREPTKKKLHMAARGTYKSSGVTCAKRVQYILNTPANCSLLGSNKAENAEKMLAEIEGHLQSELLCWLFPDILWQTPREQAEHYLKKTLTVKRPKGLRPRKEATIETNGVEGELVSNHYEHGTFDDCVGYENSQTRSERMKVIDWYEAAQALIDQPTPELATQDITNTPWDYDDMIAHLLKKRERGEIKLAVYSVPCWEPDPAGIEVPGRGPMRATFPEKLSVPVLIDMRKSMPLRFSAQYELTPADQDSAVFKRKDPSERDGIPYGIPAIVPRREAPPLQSMWLVITIDPAISVKGWADNSALAVSGFDHQNRQHVLWLKWGKWSETQLIEEAYLAYNHFAAKGNPPAIIGFEAIAFQRLYLHLFREAGDKRQQYLNIMRLERDTKNTKQTRQLVLEPAWNGGDLILYDDLDALNDLLDMANKFRTHKELTRDDLLDVLADAHQLRVRPEAPRAQTERGHDPDIVERLKTEDAIQERRREQGMAPLDGASVRLARLAQMEKARLEEERMQTALGAGVDEQFVTAGW